MIKTTPAVAAYSHLASLSVTSRFIRRSARLAIAALLAVFLCAFSVPAHAQAYGSINNFDCVNDTGYEAHGFDIELDDIHSTDITYTYDWNHYGVPKITEDNTDPLHPKVLVRYAGTFAGGVWSAYTAIPSAPIAPTQGHQFTDPSVNFGGEHFGVGYTVNPSAVKYNWLIDPTNTGTLVHGPPVNVSTPVFTYNPPPAPNIPANVVAVIVPPPPPAPPVFKFGDASWVKEIKTITHNAGKVHLNDLVADDPGQPQPWANGELAEVEMEWRLMQTEFAAANGGKNGELAGAAEDLPGGDEVITRRYEFFKYIGPIDQESGEAMGDTVGAADPDGIHYFGSGVVTYNDHIDPNTGEWVTVTVDLSTVWVVGEFFGAQMAAHDAAPVMGLIDHIQDGLVGEQYPNRTVVVAGGTAFIANIKSGALPDGLSLDPVSGILSGTPTKAGTFNFEVEASDLTAAYLTMPYTVTISAGAVASYSITTSASPAVGGTTSGDGSYNSGDSVTVNATANPGYNFLNWTHGGAVFSSSSSYTFTAIANIDLVANFALDNSAPTTTASLAGTAGTNGWYTSSVQVTLNATDPDGAGDVAETFYILDGGAQQTYTGQFDVSGDASHTLVFWSQDKAGNTEPQVSQTINIDSTAPTVTFGSSSPSPVGGWNTTAVDLTYTASDNLSGVASALPGSPLHFGSEGFGQTQTVVVTDAAGKTASFVSPAVNIDMTPPVLTATASPSMIWPHNGKMVTVTISGNASDALSGIETSSGSFSTVDSYGLVEPTGSFTIGAGGNYSFTIQVEARINKKDTAGRTYTVTLDANDIAGNPVSKTVVVTVPYKK